MKLNRLLAESALHWRLARVAVNAAAWLLFPAHRPFYVAGIRRGLKREAPSRLGVLLAANPAKVPEIRLPK